MSSTQKPNPPPKPEKKVDPYAITGYLLAGMVLYGGLGWLIDRWAGTSNVYAPIGVIFGLAAGLYLTFRQVSVWERQEREALLRRRRALVDQSEDVRDRPSASQQDLQDQHEPHDR